MQTVQLAIHDPAYRAALETALFQAGSWQVLAVVAPDPGRDGVIVLDAPTLDQYAAPLDTPERVVLVTHKDPEHLAQAWDAGIVSVVFDDEPIATAMLAIMSASLRAPHHREGGSAGGEATASQRSAERPCPRRTRLRNGSSGTGLSRRCHPAGDTGKEV
jgi:hypothetical protein